MFSAMARADTWGTRTTEYALRPVLALLIAAVGTWLIPDKSSVGLVLAVSLPLVVVSGGVAGLRFAWLAVPAGLTASVLAYRATDCAGCGGGGEEVVSPLGWILLVVAVASGIASSGPLLARWLFPARSCLRPVPVLGGVVLFGAAFGVLAAIRQSENATVRGEVVYEAHGIRYQSGRPYDGAGSSIDQAARESLRGEPPVWVGLRAGPFELSSMQWAPDMVLLVYGACGPAPCSPPVTLTMKWHCGAPPEVTNALSPPVTRDGVVFVDEPIGASAPGAKKVVWTGRLQVTIYALPGFFEAGQIAGTLRRLDGRPLVAAEPYC